MLLANDEELERKLVYLLQLYATLHFADEHQLQRKEQTSCEDKNMIGSKEKERVSCKEKKRPFA